jgi:DNA-binding protein HU-beta
VKGKEVNSSELIERIAEEHGISKDHTRKIIDGVVAAITSATAAGDEVNLTGFGRFKAADRAARLGRNPATGETIEIPASRKLTFSPAKAVRDALNASGSEPKAAAD